MNPVDERLARVFRYDAVDLAANRAGQLSPEQERQYSSLARGARRHPPRMMAFVLLAVGAGFGYFASQGDVPRDQLFLVGGLLLLFVAVIGALLMLNYRRADRMEHMQVLVTQGLPAVKSTTTPEYKRLVVGGVKFNMMWDDTECFDPRTEYRVYYSHIGIGSPVILSLEIVR
ncbi:MAG: hypothetical protein WCC60_03630 [Ilumatobacteraceae bacterium]